LSARSLREIDCNEEKYRTFQYSFYSEKMLTGKLIHTTQVSPEWEFIAPGTMNRDVMDFICKK